jgi:hypothetical protein
MNHYGPGPSGCRRGASEILTVGDGTCLVALSKGQTAIIDECDADMVGSLRWHASYSPDIKGYYARDSKGRAPMHRMIMDCPRTMMVDHINGDTLDNRRCNLRITNSRGNQNNRKDNGGNIVATKTGFRVRMIATKNCKTYKEAQIYAAHFRRIKLEILSKLDI